MLAVSVVIPCRDGARYLPAALASVGAQWQAPLEIIVVDDASSDDSREIARACGATCIAIEERIGASAARNRGIQAARGDVIAFLDADDEWHPDHLARLTEALVREPDAAAAFSLVRIVGEREGVARFNREVLAIVDALGDGPVDLGEWLFRSNPVSQSATLVRREALLDVHGYDSGLHYAEDYDLWLRLSVHHRFVRCRAFTCTYRLHPQQVSSQRDAVPRFIRAQWRSRVRHLQTIRELGDVARHERLVPLAWDLWESDMREVSRLAEWSAADVLLEALDSLPASERRERLARYWTRVRRLGPLWSVIRAVWDIVPAPVQKSVRRMRGLSERPAGDHPAPHDDFHTPVDEAPGYGIGGAVSNGSAAHGVRVSPPSPPPPVQVPRAE